VKKVTGELGWDGFKLSGEESLTARENHTRNRLANEKVPGEGGGGGGGGVEQVDGVGSCVLDLAVRGMRCHDRKEKKKETSGGFEEQLNQVRGRCRGNSFLR